MKESAELNKTKRIKHSFSRKELYHRFIHSEEYAYSPLNSHQISCKGNYLVEGNVGKNTTIEDIERLWEYYGSSRIIAIINRAAKRILINKNHDYHVWNLQCAIPDDYEIYYTDENIPNKDVLINPKDYLRIHSKYLVKDFVDKVLASFYSILYTNKTTLYKNINDKGYEDSPYWYNQLVKFVNDNKIRKYDFYKECFDEKHKIRLYISSRNTTIKEIKLPSLKQIIDNKVFNSKEKRLLEQRWFWTKYCYGNHISFNDVVDNWNKEITREDAIKYINKILCIDNSCFTNEHTWTQYIITAITKNRNKLSNIVDEALKQTKINYENAKAELERLNNTDYTINDWRNGKNYSSKSITYRRFVPAYRKNQTGTWINDTLYTNKSYVRCFKNIQLRLNYNKTIIETSNYASVPLEEGIKMYKMFVKARNNRPDITSWTTSDFGNVKVGIYNLRYITYKDKVTDTGSSLGYKEWIIQIGCHSLWLDDVIDFIKYYNLEDKFGLH